MKRNFIQIALLSATLIGMELIWTRLFSAEFFYTFAFLILSAAILGLGLGALALRIFPSLNKHRNAWIYLTLAGLMTLASPPLVFALKIDFSLLFSDATQPFRLAGGILLLNSAYFFGGMALALMFRNDHKEMPRLYMADLLGAGLGGALAVLLMNLLQTPATAAVCAVPALIAALMAAPRRALALPVILIGLSAAAAPFAYKYLRNDVKDRAPVIYTHWDACSKIKIYQFDKENCGINIDNIANTPVYKFDGNWNKPDSLKFQFGIDVGYLIRKAPRCRFLSLGSGGGTDVLQALQYGASEIHAVEVIPHINYLMQHGALASYSGRIYDDPRVKVVTEDARAYIRRFNDKFDLIYSLSSNSWAALATGAFALAENYIFTEEAFSDYWHALSANGYMMMEHQLYIPRVVSELMTALKKEGVARPEKHFAVYNLPSFRRKMILISKKELDTATINNAFGPLASMPEKSIHLLYPAPEKFKSNLINRIVRDCWQSCADSSETDISPCTDNRPFIAQLGLWKNFTPAALKKLSPYEFKGFPVSKMMIVMILALVTIIVLPLNIIPYMKKGPKLGASTFLYFFSIGLAFMAVEVVLMQKYALLIGSPAYSITAILLTLLISSGIGSRFSCKISDSGAFLGIAICMILDIFAFPALFGILGGLPLGLRIASAAIMIAPLGFFMGMPFPKGALKAGELIDWAFAVNGAASVMGSALVVLAAISFGFTIPMICALALYCLAYIMLTLDAAGRSAID